MNPFADFVDIPASQFLLVYVGIAFFAVVFLAYLRWEFGRVEGEPPVDVEAYRAKMLLRLRLAVAAIVLLLVGLAGIKVAKNLERGKPVSSIVAAIAMTLLAGAVLAAPPGKDPGP